MSIASEITRLQTAKSDLATSIANKGVTVPSSATLDDYAALVDSIQTGGGGGETLPYDAEVEYLQSDGASFFDLGIIGNSYLEYEVKFTWESGNYAYILGAQTSDSSNRFSLMTGTTSNRYLYFNNGNSNNQKTYTLTSSEKANTIIVRKVYNDIFVNGGRKFYFTGTTYQTPVSITVFTGHQPSSYLNFFTGRIYYLKIGNMDLIPVRIGSVGYLYDKTSGRLFSNVGTGSFTLGPDVS